MKMCYSGKKKVKIPKVIKVIDELYGPVRFTTDVVHYFNNGTSIYGFLKMDKKRFVSVTTFVKNDIGRYILSIDKMPKEHEPFEGKLEFVPMHLHEVDDAKFVDVKL